MAWIIRHLSKRCRSGISAETMSGVWILRRFPPFNPKIMLDGLGRPRNDVIICRFLRERYPLGIKISEAVLLRAACAR